MANEIRNWVKTKNLGNTIAKQVFLEIADLASDAGVCDATIPQIAATLELSTKSVERGLAFLETEKLIVRKEAKRKFGQFPPKITRIKLPSEIKQKIADRRSKYGLSPTDSQSDGDIPEETQFVDAPTDCQSVGEANQQTDSPPPTDSQSNRLTVCLNKEESSKDYTQETGKLSFCARASAAEVWREVYPDSELDSDQEKDLVNRLPEIEESVWRQNLLDWRLNKWGRFNISGQINRYKTELDKFRKEEEKSRGSTTKPTNGNGSGGVHRSKATQPKSSAEVRSKLRVKKPTGI